MNPFREQTKGRWKYLFQLAYGINTWYVMHIQIVSTLYTFTQRRLESQVAPWRGPSGTFGPLRWISRSGEATLALCSSCQSQPRWISPPDIGGMILTTRPLMISSENFKSTFCGAACSSVGGPMMFSLKKILVTYICEMPSPFIFPEIPPNCGRDVTARPASKVVHHHCSGFLRVPVKNNHFHWILRTPYDQKVAPL